MPKNEIPQLFTLSRFDSAGCFLKITNANDDIRVKR